MSAPGSAPGTTAPGTTAPGTVVLDLDGVLADTRHRMHHLRGRPRDWDRFFAAAPEDPVHPEGLALATAAAQRGAPVVYLSGRPERTRSDTLAWLRRVGAPPGPVVLRADGDRRPARLVKVAALKALAAAGPLEVLVDDDPDVVHAVRGTRPPLVGAVLLADWQPRDADPRDAQDRAGRT